VRQFFDRIDREPEALTDDDVRVFFIHTVQRNWAIFDLLRVR